MSQVDFHILDSTEPAQALHYACRLINKAYHHGHRLYVRVANADQAQQLDKMLWSFSDLAFVPHCIEGATELESVPVEISIMGSTSDPDAILVNLADSLPESYSDHQRVIEIVSGDQASTEAARVRYRSYRERGDTLETHKIGNPQ